MYSIITTSQFEKDMLRAKKQKKNMTELARVLLLLENGEKLPEKYQNHKLKNIKQETWNSLTVKSCIINKGNEEY